MGKKILIIDDEETFQKLVGFILREKGYNVVMAFDAEEGLQKVSAEKPQMVLLDINLPGQDGYEILKKIRENPLYKAVPVIMVSVRNKDEDELKGFRLGCDDYVTKPFEPEELNARVDRLFRRQEAQA